MKAKRTNYLGVFALLLVGAAGVYGVGSYIGQTPDARRPSSVASGPTPTYRPNGRIMVVSVC